MYKKYLFLSLLCVILTGMSCIQSVAQQKTFIEGTELKIFTPFQLRIPEGNSTDKITRSHYRSYDGTNNSIGTTSKALWGSANIPLFRELPPVYGPSDTKNAIGGVGRPSPREISNVVVDEPENTFNALEHTAFVYVWGQFLDHDMSLTPGDTIESVPIPLPADETIFTEDIPFTRSQVRPGTGVTNKRQQSNLQTSWIDGSMVYGTDSTSAAWMRTHVNGKMKTSQSSTQGTLAEWNFPNNPDDAIADVSIAANSEKTFYTTGGTSALTFNVTGVTTQAAWCTGWNSGSGTKAWEIQLTTTGFTNLKLSSQQQGSNTGPRDFAIEYKIGAGGTWTLLGVPVTLNTSGWHGPVSFTLPPACENQTSLYIHWIMTSNTAINGTTVASGGASRIDNINISGIDSRVYLPWNTVTGQYADAIDPTAPGMANDGGHTTKTFVAGDVRAAEHPGLTALHTLFVREHNRQCDLLVAQGQTNDELNYQAARKYVGALIQAITYQEFLPALGITLDPYTTYQPKVRPDIANSFATASYRIGHTMVADDVKLRDDNCAEVPPGSLDLIEIFWNPQLVVDYGIDPFLKGNATHKHYEIDTKINETLRNFLFTSPNDTVRFGIDLASLNIQRGRDHGLPDYNTMRQYYTGSKATSFAQITSNTTLASQLQSLYGTVDNIDLWVGILAEDHLPGKSVGNTMHQMLKAQFQKLRDGDYYFYLHDPWLSANDRNSIINTTFADVIERNTSLTSLQTNVFLLDTCPGENGEDRIIAANNSVVSSDDIKVYPNPANDIVHIDRSNIDEPCTIKLFTASGVLVKTITSAPQNHLQMNVKGLSNGVYVINIISAKEIKSVRFVKMGE
jgi:hypothetical protein